MSRTSRILHQLASYFAIIILIVAVLVSFARWLTPLFNQHKAFFEQRIEHLLGTTVKIGGVQAAFKGFEPSFSFSQLMIEDPNKHQPLFKVKQLTLSIDLFHSLLQGRLITGNIIIDGAQIDLQQGKDGSWRINDHQLATEQQTSPDPNSPLLSQDTIDVLDWILAQRRIVLQNIVLHWYRPQQQQPLILPDVDLKLVTRGSHHLLRGITQLGEGSQSWVQIAADFYGDINHWQHMHGDVYAGAKQLNFSKWLPMQQITGLNLQHGSGNVQCWGHFGEGKLRMLHSVFRLRNVSLETGKQSIPIERFNGNVKWRQLADNQGWQLIGNRLGITINHHRWPMTDFGIKIANPNTDDAHQLLHLRHVELGDITPLILQNQWLPASFREQWRQINPHGTIHDVDFFHQGRMATLSMHNRCIAGPVTLPWIPAGMPLPNDSPLDWRHCEDSVNFPAHLYARASVEDFSTHAYKIWPGLKNITASMMWRPQHIHLTMNSHYGALALPHWFANSIIFSDFDVIADMVYRPRHWQVNLQKFHVSNQYVDINGQAQLKQRGQRSPRLNSLLHIHQRGSQYLRQLMPVKIMSPNLRYWLTHAFEAGKSLDGTVVYRGNLADFPFNRQRGVFIADANIKDMQLNFTDGWPTIKHLNAHALFHNNSMRVQLLSGNIFGQAITRARASVARLGGHDASDLVISGGVTLDTGDGLNFVQHSPLRDELSGLKLLTMKGLATLDLQLTVPLADAAQKTTVDGHVELVNNQLAVPDYHLQMQKLNGHLRFTEQGIWAEKLTGQLFNNPASLHLTTKVVGRKNSVVQLDVDNRISMGDLFDHFAWKKTPLVTGAMNYHGRLSIPEHAPTQLKITSDLIGVKLDLLKRYAKSAPQKRPLRVSAVFDAPKSKLRLDYNQQVNAAMLLEKNQQGVDLHSAEVALGGRKAHYQKVAGIVISGYLPKIDWSVWKDYWQQHFSNNTHKVEKSSGLLGKLRKVAVVVGELDAFKQTLRDPFLTFTRTLKNWQFGIDSPQVLGQINIPQDYPKNPIAATFTRLYVEPIKLATVDGDKKNAKKTPLSVNLNATDMPPLQLQVNDLRYGKRQFGEVQLQLKPIPQGVDIQRLNITTPAIKLGLTGQWIEDSKYDITDINGHAQLSDLGNVLNNWQLTDKLVKGKGRVKFSLGWADTPYAITSRGLQGEIEVNLQQGSIIHLGKNADAKLGWGKLLNSLSIQSIFRRLTLNFDDWKQGYSYDTLRGDAIIRNGIITTNNLRINGSVAKASVNGNVNLVDKHYNLLLHIAPHLTSSVPVLATLVGGPIVGAAAWVADKMIGSTVDNAVSSTLLIFGPWDNPEISTWDTFAGASMKNNEKTIAELNQQALTHRLQVKSK